MRDHVRSLCLLVALSPLAGCGSSSPATSGGASDGGEETSPGSGSGSGGRSGSGTGSAAGSGAGANGGSDSGAESGTSTDGGSGVGSGSGTGEAPAITTFVLTNEGANSMSLAWSAVAGTKHYNIYRNGTLAGQSTDTTYTDSEATHATSPSYTFPATVYRYAVSAVDASGHEGGQQTNLTYWMYNTNTSVNINPTKGNTNPNSSGDMNFVAAANVAGPSGNASIPGNFIQGNYTCAPNSSLIYNDTAGKPVNSPFDFAFSGCGYNQPYSGPPTVAEYALEVGAFKYMNIELKPTVANVDFQFSLISRLPQGDVFNQASIDLSNGKYGPVPAVGKWGTYKIPLKDAELGTGSFTGSISGNKLTVTSVSAAGVNIQNGGWVLGGGLASPVHIDCDRGSEDGSCTASGGYTGNGGPGTYEVNPAPATPIANATFTVQRTDMYKLGLTTHVNGSPSTDVYYMNNLGFSVE